MNYLVHFFNNIKYKNNVITHQFIKTYNILRKSKYESIWKSTKKIKTAEKCKPNFCSPPIINIPNGNGHTGPTGATGATGAQGETGGAMGNGLRIAIIETTTINSILIIRNLADNSTVLTITPSAGRTQQSHTFSNNSIVITILYLQKKYHWRYFLIVI